MNEYIMSALSGITSAIVTKTSIAPLERIKILQQVQSYYKINNYQTITGSFRYIYKHEGWLGYYKGNIMNILRIAPAYMLKFPLNEFYKKKFNATTYPRLLLSGMLASLSQTVITYPLDLLRTRITLDSNMMSNNSKIIQCCLQVIRQEGFLSLYKGIKPNIISYPFYAGIQLSLYEYLRNYYHYNPFISGAVAGLTAQTLLYPGDTIKRHMQINQTHNNLRRCIQTIYRTHGMKGFYPGLRLNIIKCIPEVIIQFSIYELCRSYF